MNLHQCAHWGDLEGIRQHLAQGADLEQVVRGCTPLMMAVKSPHASVAAMQLLLDAGANANATTHRHSSILNMALFADNLDKLTTLLNAGAKFTGHCATSCDPLRYVGQIPYCATSVNLPALLPVFLNKDTGFCSRARHQSIGTVSINGRFDLVRVLLEQGCDLAGLQWTPLMFAIAIGSAADVEHELGQRPDLSMRDRFDRTPWLLSAEVGDIAKAGLLMSAGADRDARGRTGKTALQYAAANGHAELVQWLIEQGCAIDATDDSEHTALFTAAEVGAADCVRVLLAAGANPWGKSDDFRGDAIHYARTLECARLLIAAGCGDWSDVDDVVRRQLLKLDQQAPLRISREQFLQGRHPRFGSSNPERMSNPVWQALVQSGDGAGVTRGLFFANDRCPDNEEPGWSYERFGRSLTPLPDGRFIEIGGEHEDFYDPDFHIYNDVVVHHGNGSFDIYGYPEAAFPPTDGHTATLVGEYIYVIGNLGYRHLRRLGFTPVYRLHIHTLTMEVVDSGGEYPGWISRHKARLTANGEIEVWAGDVLTGDVGSEDLVANAEQYTLNLETRRWRRM